MQQLSEMLENPSKHPRVNELDKNDKNSDINKDPDQEALQAKI